MFSLICAWINGWVNNREAGDLRRHRAHYYVTVLQRLYWNQTFVNGNSQLPQSYIQSGRICGDLTYSNKIKITTRRWENDGTPPGQAINQRMHKPCWAYRFTTTVAVPHRPIIWLMLLIRGHAHMGQMGQWPSLHATKDPDYCIKLLMNKICSLV